MCLEGENGMELTFKHTVETDEKEVYLAWIQPWSYQEDQDLLASFQEKYKNDPEIYFNRELLCLSKEERRVELITISSHLGKLDKRERVLPQLFPQASANARSNVYSFLKFRIIP
jgi:hypothetical protein